MARTKKKARILHDDTKKGVTAKIIVDLSEYDDDAEDEACSIEAILPQKISSKESAGTTEAKFPPVLFSNSVPRDVSARALTTHNSLSTSIGEDKILLPQKRKEILISDDKENSVAPRKGSGEAQAALTVVQARLWLHKFAANASLQSHHFPRHVFRLLGSITRIVDQPVDVKTGKFKTPHQFTPRQRKLAPSEGINNRRYQKKLTKNMAKCQAFEELQDGLIDDSQVEARSETILQEWMSLSAEAASKHHYKPTDGWSPVDGSLVAVQDKQYVSITSLLRWMEKSSVIDRHNEEHCSLYHGLKRIPVDTKSVLDALLDLSSPEGLYGVPLIMPYAVVTQTAACAPLNPRGKSTASSSVRAWKISIGVYAHRLLPEVMSCGPLHTVMSALDPGTYKCVQPIQLPPAPREAVFESSPLPLVTMEWNDDEVEDTKEAAIEENTDDSMDEGQKEPQKNKKSSKLSKNKKNVSKGEVPAGTQPTRDEQRISAFTTRGLLKLLESRGNDTSNWPNLQSKILPHLQLKLMLHQEHAICWMVQMESLGGFGINSVLWETREFIDGGKYYYSPALGQIRLRPPPTMKGGLLCDEMGLGKTIEVLGLILATLDDLKQEAAKHSVDDSLKATHATLIVVPPALVSQWLDEIRKATGDSLAVEYFDFKTLSFHPKGNAASPDIVLTTYTALEKPTAARHLSSRAWGRVVLDEMQEVRQSTSKIARNCEQLTCNRRWMLSGTPLFEGIDDLRGELNFLRLEPFAAALEDGFFQFAIADHWERRDIIAFDTIRILGLFILRRSKGMTIRGTGIPILGLKPLTIEHVPISQSLSERALYCFLEYVLAHEVRDPSRERGSPLLCLRLLRELCISTTLLNGGLGVSSQMKTLNDILVDQARREFAPIAALEELDDDVPDTRQTYSCDEAIRYLAIVQQAARAGDNEVSFLHMGFGQGMARRVRAEQAIEDQLRESNETLDKAIVENEKLRRKRAVALWHSALELVTTGHFPIVKLSKFSSIWRWRHLVAQLNLRFPHVMNSKSFPTLLTRGWRPSQRFAKLELFQSHPNFIWAHPLCLELKGIPVEVETRELSQAVMNALRDPQKANASAVDVGSSDGRFVIDRKSLRSSWNAYLQLRDPNDFLCLQKMSCRIKGIQLPSVIPIPFVEKAKTNAKEKFDEATAKYTLLPSAKHHSEREKAEKVFREANLGLRILKEGRHGEHVAIASALTSRRSLAPKYTRHLLSINEDARRECHVLIYRNSQTIDSCRQRIGKLELLVGKGVSREVEAMSAFEILDALSNGQADKTQCPICLGSLGETGNNGVEADLVAMTKCGHLYCSSCLDDYMNQTRTINGKPPCPSCRKQIHPADVMRVNPSKRTEQDLLLSRQQKAKEVVMAAAHLLETSDGQLAPHMWEQLFLSIDRPEGVDSALDGRFVAIPREVLAHVRAATRMPVHCPRQASCFKDEGRRRDVLYSSKVQALLDDVPRNERSVVFSSSQACIKHLQVVLEKEGVGCRVLFSGQSVQDSERALSEWKSSVASVDGEQFPHPVLLVQSGAAASGLTLTAACKVFFMEPFLRHEEEQQAYSRCHRFGQERPVHVKIYYAPVSVESRLLEWRRLAGGGQSRTNPLDAAACQRISDSSKQDVDERDPFGFERNSEDDGDEVEYDNADQTEFLLGLHPANCC